MHRREEGFGVWRQSRSPWWCNPVKNSAAAQALRNVKARMERVKGIEPSYEAWEAAVLPLNYTRCGSYIF